MKFLIAVTMLGCALTTPARAQSGAVSPRWGVAGSSLEDFAVSRDTTTAHEGRTSIRFIAEERPTGFGGIGTQILAGPYEGRRVRVSAWLRGAGLEPGGGVVWARADGATPAFSTSQASPVVGTIDWTPVEIMLDVPRGARALVFGMFSSGRGTLWIDDVHVRADSVPEMIVSFEDPATLTVPPRPTIARSPREAARALTPRGLDNIGAFTRLLSYVRFFHPAPEARTVNWDEFAVRGMRAVESASSAAQLADTLNKLFAPIAPSVAVYRTGSAVPAAPVAPALSDRIVYWRHVGVGVPSGGALPPGQNIYSSVRVLARPSAAGTPIELPTGRQVASEPAPRIPDPARPLQLPLGAGVTVSLPVALYTTEVSIGSDMQSPKPAAMTARLSADDRATRLAAVALAWGVLQHFYPYHEIARTDWPATLRTSLTRAAADTDGVQFQETLDRMIAALRDGHGRVSSSNTPMYTPDARLGRIEGRVVVLAVGDSSAKAGLRRGDEILTVDGRAVGALMAELGERVSGATPQWVEYRVISTLLVSRGSAPVRLRVSDGTSPRDVVLPRTGTRAVELPLPDKIVELLPGTFYVDLSRISDEDFAGVLPKLVTAKGIVFDMRGYPKVSTPVVLAHLSDSVIYSARFESPLLTLPDRADMRFISGGWTLPPRAPRIKAKVVFLTGGGAISYAESTMGVVEENSLGERVGEPTAGTNGNVNPFMLPGGYTVSWTGMLVTKRNGTPHHGVGVMPTVPVSPTLAGFRAGRDEVLDRAVQLVGTALVP